MRTTRSSRSSCAFEPPGSARSMLSARPAPSVLLFVKQPVPLSEVPALESGAEGMAPVLRSASGIRPGWSGACLGVEPAGLCSCTYLLLSGDRSPRRPPRKAVAGARHTGPSLYKRHHAHSTFEIATFPVSALF